MTCTFEYLLYISWHPLCVVFISSNLTSLNQADILYLKCEMDVVVLYRLRHGTGKSLHHYGTPGLAEEFIRKSEHGQTLSDMFQAFCHERGEKII